MIFVSSARTPLDQVYRQYDALSFFYLVRDEIEKQANRRLTPVDDGNPLEHACHSSPPPSDPRIAQASAQTLRCLPVSTQ